MLLFGPAAELGEMPAGVEVVDAPVSIAKAADPVARGAHDPEASIVMAARAVAEGSAQALVCAGGDRRGARGRDLQHQTRPRHLPARAGDPVPGARAGR